MEGLESNLADKLCTVVKKIDGDKPLFLMDDKGDIMRFTDIQAAQDFIDAAGLTDEEKAVIEIDTIILFED